MNNENPSLLTLLHIPIPPPVFAIIPFSSLSLLCTPVLQILFLWQSASLCWDEEFIRQRAATNALWSPASSPQPPSSPPQSSHGLVCKLPAACPASSLFTGKLRSSTWLPKKNKYKKPWKSCCWASRKLKLLWAWEPREMLWPAQQVLFGRKSRQQTRLPTHTQIYMYMFSEGLAKGRVGEVYKERRID